MVGISSSGGRCTCRDAPRGPRRATTISSSNLALSMLALSLSQSVFGAAARALYYVSLLHSLMVLSFSRAAEAMMFSVGWQAVHRTTSVWPTSFCTISLDCRFQT